MEAEIINEEMKKTYDSAQAQANRWGYGDRIKAEQAELKTLVSRESTLSSEEALKNLSKAVALPKDSIDKILKRSTKIFAISIVARRKLIKPQADPEWFFVAGKAIQADTQSGRVFFERYLAQPKGVVLKHRVEAQKELEEITKLSTGL